MPVALAGLPGDSMLRLPVVGPSQTSRWIACVDSPANVRANPGRSLVFCCWSMTRVNPSPSRSSWTSAEITSIAAQAAFRNSGSASIAKTLAGGASYDSSWRNFMAGLWHDRRCWSPSRDLPAALAWPCDGSPSACPRAAAACRDRMPTGFGAPPGRRRRQQPGERRTPHSTSRVAAVTCREPQRRGHRSASPQPGRPTAATSRREQVAAVRRPAPTPPTSGARVHLDPQVVDQARSRRCRRRRPVAGSMPIAEPGWPCARCRRARTSVAVRSPDDCSMLDQVIVAAGDSWRSRGSTLERVPGMVACDRGAGRWTGREQPRAVRVDRPISGAAVLDDGALGCGVATVTSWPTSSSSPSASRAPS